MPAPATLAEALTMARKSASHARDAARLASMAKFTPAQRDSLLSIAHASWRRRRDFECHATKLLDGTPRRPRDERIEHPIVWTVDAQDVARAS